MICNEKLSGTNKLTAFTHLFTELQKKAKKKVKKQKKAKQTTKKNNKICKNQKFKNLFKLKSKPCKRIKFFVFCFASLLYPTERHRSRGMGEESGWEVEKAKGKSENRDRKSIKVEKKQTLS